MLPIENGTEIEYLAITWSADGIDCSSVIALGNGWTGVQKHHMAFSHAWNALNIYLTNNWDLQDTVLTN